MSRNILSVKCYECGSCTKNLGRILRGHQKEWRKLPANVFLIRHRVHGYILFDTGYDSDITNISLRGRLHGVVSRVEVNKPDMLVAQLKRDGLEPRNIKTVILSHLHPGCIGGLQDFRRSDSILSEEAMRAYKYALPSAMILKIFLPNNFESQAWAVPTDTLQSKETEFFKGYDLYDDGSVILTQLDGHARGQLGALIDGKIFLAGDACYAADLIEDAHELRLGARLAQDNMKAYRKTLRQLARMRNAGIRICFSHDKFANKTLYKREDLV